MPWPRSSISLSIASAETFNFGHAVADLTDDADILLGRSCLSSCDLSFNFLQ